MEGNATAVAVQTEEVGIYRRGSVWWVQYYDLHGRQVRESSRSSTLEVAKRLRRRRLVEKEKGEEPVKAARIKVDDLAEGFLLDYRNNGQAVGWAGRCWAKHLKPFFGGMRASAVTTDDMNRYIGRRKAEGASNGTINGELACLHRMFTLAVHCTPPKVQHVPIFPERLYVNNARKGFVEDDQYRRLCEHCGETWLRALLAVAYSVGCRKSELLKLQVKHVNLPDRAILLIDTKNGEDRVVPMTDEVCRLLFATTRGKGPDEFVFTWDNGQPVRDIRGSWDNLTEAAGLPGLLLHDFRRSAVRNMVRRGVPETVAMKITGHKTRAVFDRYNITSGADLVEAARRIEQGRENGHRTGTEAIDCTALPMLTS